MVRHLKVCPLLAHACRQAAPCLLFFDEFDSVGGRRSASSSGGGDAAAARVLNQLLVEMDGLTGVVLRCDSRCKLCGTCMLHGSLCFFCASLCFLACLPGRHPCSPARCPAALQTGAACLCWRPPTAPKRWTPP